jgi:hypothetical protein
LIAFSRQVEEQPKEHRRVRADDHAGGLDVNSVDVRALGERPQGGLGVIDHGATSTGSSGRSTAPASLRRESSLPPRGERSTSS